MPAMLTVMAPAVQAALGTDQVITQQCWTMGVSFLRAVAHAKHPKPGLFTHNDGTRGKALDPNTLPFGTDCL